MDMYRTFVAVKDKPELWVIDVETDHIVGIALGVVSYMADFTDLDWEIVSVSKLNKKIDVLVEDIILN